MKECVQPVESYILMFILLAASALNQAQVMRIPDAAGKKCNNVLRFHFNQEIRTIER